MRCERCGQEYPSRHYFQTATVCKNCYAKLTPEEQRIAEASVDPELIHGDAEAHTIMGHPLTCIVCGHDKFWTRKTLMNTPGVTFLGFDWANKQAENYVCNHCGYVMWFLR